MKKLIEKIYHLSPAILVNFIVENTLRLLGKAEWVTIKHGYLKGIKLFVNLRRNQVFNDMVQGRYDEFIFKALKTKNLDTKVIWDIGAFIGHDTLGFARLVGSKGRVLAFDPNPANLDRLSMHLKENHSLGKRVQVVNLALGEKVGSASFDLNTNIDSAQSSGGHLSKVVPPMDKEVYQHFDKLRVFVSTIDYLVFKQNLPVPDLIHLDVEGAEVVVLIGAKITLGKYKPIILAEIHHIQAMAGVCRELYSHDYEIAILETAEDSTSRCFIVATKKEAVK